MLPRGRSASRLPLLSLAVLLVSLLLAGHVGAVDENVMDTDGDGQVSTEEFIEHAQCQEAGGECKAKPSLRSSGDGEAPAGGEGGDEPEGLSPAEVAAMKEVVKAAVKAGRPVLLGNENAAAILDGENNIFAKFSTSWCGHCVKMQPDWEQLAQEVHQDYSGLLVVSVDCEKSADLCQAFQVQGYPTVMLLTATKTPEGELGYQPTPYSKDRTAGPMLAFLREQKACKAKNMFKSLFRFLWTQVKGVLAIQVQMPK